VSFSRTFQNRFAAVFLLLLVTAGCSPADKSGRFSIAIGNLLRSEHPAQLDLAKIDGPVWDELYIFAPKSLREDNCKVLGLGWLECRTTMPSAVAEGEDFIVFRTKGRISSAQRHAQSNGEFAMPASQQYEFARRSNALFAVELVSPGSANSTYRLKHVL
jgi:hypothetical protein